MKPRDPVKRAQYAAHDNARNRRKYATDPVYRAKILARNTASYHLNKEHRRAYDRFKKYGISVAEYDTLLERQENKCGVCRKGNQVKRNWHVDHDHETGRVRGLLCQLCNTRLANAAFHRAALIFNSVESNRGTRTDYP